MRYEWTATLSPYLHSLKNTDQYDRTAKLVEDVVKPWKSFVKAELTMNFDIHYHCIIEIPDDPTELNKFHNRRRQWKQLGRVKTFRPVQYEQSWEDYLTKRKLEQDKIFVKIVNRPVILLDQLNIVRKVFYGGDIIDTVEDVVAELRVRHKEDTSSLDASLDAIDEAIEWVRQNKLQ